MNRAPGAEGRPLAQDALVALRAENYAFQQASPEEQGQLYTRAVLGRMVAKSELADVSATSAARLDLVPVLIMLAGMLSFGVLVGGGAGYGALLLQLEGVL